MAKASGYKSQNQEISEKLDHSKPAESAHLAVFTGDIAKIIGEVMEAMGMSANQVIAEAIRRIYEQEVVSGSQKSH